MECQDYSIIIFALNHFKTLGGYSKPEQRYSSSVEILTSRRSASNSLLRFYLYSCVYWFMCVFFISHAFFCSFFLLVDIKSTANRVRFSHF